MDELKLREYMVCTGGKPIARGMTFEVAMMLVEAFHNNYHRESIDITIKEEPRCEVVDVKNPRCRSCLHFRYDEHGPKCKLRKEYIPMSVVESGCNEYF